MTVPKKLQPRQSQCKFKNIFKRLSASNRNEIQERFASAPELDVLIKKSVFAKVLYAVSVIGPDDN